MSVHEEVALARKSPTHGPPPPADEWIDIEFADADIDAVVDVAADEDVAAEGTGRRRAGTPDRTAPLTWGQWALRFGVERYPANRILINMRRVVPVPRRAPDGVDDVRRAVGALVGRHSSLRTRMPVTDGRWHQAVAAAGRLPTLLARAAADDADGTATARAVADRLAATAFDFAEEWPLRVALVLVDGRVRQIVVVFSHTTVDFGAVEVLLRDLRLLLLRGTLDAPVGPQSIDVAGREQDPRYRRRSIRCVARWSTGFGRLTEQTLPWRAPPLEPRFRRAFLESGAADTALRLLASRHRVTSSTVLLTATTVVLARRSGNEVVGLYTMVSNRALDGYREAVANLAQLGLAVVDLADRPSFANLLPTVWRAALDAYRHAYYDPSDLRRTPESTGYPSAPGTSPHCYFNDIRLATDLDLFGRATSEAEVRAAMTGTTFSWLEHLDDFPWRTRVEVVDRPGALGFILTADSAYLPPEEAESFLRELEQLLVDAAFRDLPWPWE
ncbi:condensation domain-containing protein [Micromonospora pisi]|uniref:Condensation domain-containing protein n=1 Tax=Micromonospora pisi TaxID=589240 RepID=A0A495JMR8_9ACTN|nr:condensation domain-containing protein [Micromonospora pisi]RKR89632.1 condensation domain-containing protein [Micromonospora pisi]